MVATIPHFIFFDFPNAELIDALVGNISKSEMLSYQVHNILIQDLY